MNWTDLCRLTRRRDRLKAEPGRVSCSAFQWDQLEKEIFASNGLCYHEKYLVERIRDRSTRKVATEDTQLLAVLRRASFHKDTLAKPCRVLHRRVFHGWCLGQLTLIPPLLSRRRVWDAVSKTEERKRDEILGHRNIKTQTPIYRLE